MLNKIYTHSDSLTSECWILTADKQAAIIFIVTQFSILIFLSRKAAVKSTSPHLLHPFCDEELNTTTEERHTVASIGIHSNYGMGRTWEKFSLPAKKQQKFETATGKENFQTETEGCTSGRKLSVTRC